VGKYREEYSKQVSCGEGQSAKDEKKDQEESRGDTHEREVRVHGEKC
jgi:hypothetical protein